MKRVSAYITQHPRHLVLALCALIFVLTSLLALRTGDDFRYQDEKDYHVLTERLISGRGYIDDQGRLSACRPPGYPFFLSAVYHIWHRPLAAKLANAFLLACVGWLLAEIVSITTPSGKAFAPLLVLLYPVFLYTATTLYPQILGTLLLVVSVYCLLRFPNAWLSSAACGLAFGALILTIPSFLPILPLIAVFWIIAQRANLIRAGKAVVLFVFCAVLVVGPWTIRNAFVFHTLVPVSTNAGFNLLLGNCEGTEPNSGVNADVRRYEAETKGMAELQADNLYKQRAREWISAHPGAALKLYALKVLNYFNYRNKLASQAEASWLKDGIMFLSYYALLGAGISRCLLWRRFHMSLTDWLCYTLYFGNALLSAIFFTRIRFRLPFDALLIVCVAVLLGYILTARRARCVAPTNP